MPTYKLVYFDMRGRAEVARYCFAHAGQEYEDKRITMDFFKETVKPKTPMGQLPVLAVDGKHLCQSGAIVRYLAKQFDLNGSNDWEAAQIDMYASGIQDVMEHLKPFMMLKMTGKKEEAEKMFADINKEHLQPFLTRYANFIKGSGGDWFVGNKVSYLDFIMHHVLTTICKAGGHANVIGPHEETFKPYLQRIQALPNIRKWLDTRPQTEN